MKQMRIEIAYAIISKKRYRGTSGLVCFNAQLPIYWNKKVAKREAELFDGVVIQVKIQELE